MHVKSLKDVNMYCCPIQVVPQQLLHAADNSLNPCDAIKYTRGNKQSHNEGQATPQHAANKRTLSITNTDELYEYKLHVRGSKRMPRDPMHPACLLSPRLSSTLNAKQGPTPCMNQKCSIRAHSCTRVCTGLLAAEPNYG